jgi:sulfatase modifying factor 1
MIGSESGLPSEQPVFATEVEPFFMDEHPVTVAQFRAFVEATGYTTEAEQFGNAGILDLRTGQWGMVQGANWKQPQGPNGPAAPDDHPVTQVSWNDAVAYAEWAGKRLPTEVEWEHAARGARNARDPYSWGKSLVEGGQHHANTWQGTFPIRNTGEDGHILTSPVGTFGKTSLGLADMGGNVWEWCENWYRPYAERGTPFTPNAQSEKAQRGGSFLCTEGFCHGYRVSARSHSTPETALFHVGFRCVKDLSES